MNMQGKNLKQQISALVNKFKTATWPWLVSGVTILFIFTLLLGANKRRDKGDELTTAVAAQTVEAKKVSEEEKRKEQEKEKKAREKVATAEYEKQKAEEEKAQQEKEKRNTPSPYADTELMRMKWFNNSLEEWGEAPDFSSLCEAELADRVQDSWECYATHTTSSYKGQYEIHTTLLKGKRKSAEKLAADKYADQMIKGVCTLLNVGNSKGYPPDDGYIYVYDANAEMIDSRSCKKVRLWQNGY